MFQISYLSYELNHRYYFKLWLSALSYLFYYCSFLMELIFLLVEELLICLFLFGFYLTTVIFPCTLPYHLSLFFCVSGTAILSQRFPGQRIFFSMWQKFNSGKRKQASYISFVLTSSAISPISAGSLVNAKIIGLGELVTENSLLLFFFLLNQVTFLVVVIWFYHYTLI